MEIEKRIQSQTHSEILGALSGEDIRDLDGSSAKGDYLDCKEISVTVASVDNVDAGTEITSAPRAEVLVDAGREITCAPRAEVPINVSDSVCPLGISTHPVLKNFSFNMPTETTNPPTNTTPTTCHPSVNRQDLSSSQSMKMKNSSNKDHESFLKIIDHIA